MPSGSQLVYCVDTSALIDLKPYPRKVFPNLWKRLEGLVGEGRLIAPPQVREELKHIDDELLKWARSQRRMFVSLSALHLECVAEILGSFPRLIDPSKETEEADPFVIALALAAGRHELFGHDHVVLTQERLKGGRPRIPHVWEHYGIRYLDVFGFFAKEGWRF